MSLNSSKQIDSIAAVILLWMGQFVSVIGTDITKFALRVWTYQRSGSVTEFALITFFTEMPSILMSPFAGAIVDRYSRKKIIICSDFISALCTLTLSLLLQGGQLNTWHIYCANTIASLMNSFQWPAFTASVSLLVPKDQLTRFGGLNQAAPAFSMLFAPAIAGTLLVSIGLEGIFTIEFMTFLFASVITIFTTIPNHTKSEESQRGTSNLFQEVAASWKFIQQRKALVALLFLSANGQFSSGMVQVLMTPLILNFSSSSVLGNILSVSGTGALVGSALLGLWGGPKNRIYGILGCASLQGLLLALCGTTPSSALILFVAFSYMVMIPFVRVFRESIWQRKVPSEMQGRVLSLQRMIGQLALPLSSLLAGPLADKIFEPLLAKSGFLATTIGKLTGIGPGRGVAFLFILLGLMNCTVALIGFSYIPLRQIDVDLPDVHDYAKRK